MKHNRIISMISVLLVLTLALVGCGSKDNASSQQTAATSQVMRNVSTVFLEKDGDKSADVTDKAMIKEIREALNNAKAVSDATAPEDEEPYVYVEWDGGDTSLYAFVYHMADGTSLIEVSESNSDNPPKYFTADTAYNDLAAMVDLLAK